MEKEFKAMTESLRLLHSDEKVGEYLRWIIKSDASKAYWQAAVRPEGLTKLECPTCGGLRPSANEM